MEKVKLFVLNYVLYNAWYKTRKNTIEDAKIIINYQCENCPFKEFTKERREV